MKRNVKKALSIFLVAAFLMGIIPMGNFGDLFSFGTKAYAQETLKASGKIGDYVTYTFDEETGVVTLSGKGETYAYGSDSGWGYDDSYLQYNPFANNPAIKAVVVENGITRVSDSLFYGCTNLESITLAESVQTIGAFTFYGCTGLTSVSLTGGVMYVLNHAFENCSGLKRVYIGKKVNTLQGNPFINCIALEEFIVDPENTIFLADSVGALYGKKYNTNIPTIIYQYPLGRNETTYTVLEGTDRVDSNAFYGCSLTKIVLPECLRTLEIRAFNNCSDLTDINITNVQTIRAYAFRDCTSLKSIALPHITGILTGTFYGCTSLENVTFQSDMTQIYKNAFYGCTALKSIDLPDEISTIDEGAFYNCTSLSEVILPDGLTEIGEYAFYNCTALENIEFNENLQYIRTGAFAASGLTSIEIPDGVSLGATSFYGCKSLKSVDFGDNVSLSYDCFNYCTALESIELPDGTKAIGAHDFFGCTNLTSIVIPASVTSIDGNPFSGCDNLTICGYAGSYAQQYAQQNNIPFELLGRNDIVEIFLDKKPTKQSYEANEEFDPTGASLRVKYEDGTIRELTTDEVEVTGFDNTSSGWQKVAFTYTENGVTLTTWAFSIVVDRQVNALYVTHKPNKTEYVMGELFEHEGMTVVATFSDGTKADVTRSINTSGFDTSATGVRKMTVSYTYKGKTVTTQFSYIMRAKLDYIRITQKPTKLASYKVGDSFSRDGMIITAYFTDGSSKEVTNIKTSGFSSKTVGKQIITVSYTYATQTRSAQFSIIMNEK